MDGNGKKAYICIAKDEFETIMIIDPYWVSLLENLLLKVTCLIMIVLERIFFISFKNVMAFRNLIYLKFNFVKGHIHKYQTQLCILRNSEKFFENNFCVPEL